MKQQADLDPQGVKWMGSIPSDWSTSPVKRHFDIQLGKMLQNNPQAEEDRLVPYAKALHVLWGNVETTNLPEMFASHSDIRQYGMASGDLLVCEGGEVGRAGMVTSAPIPCIIQNALHRVRATGTGDVEFLQYVLQAVNNSGWFDVLCNRATIAHFTREKFAALQIPLPPSVEEQRAIATFLDRKTAHIDALIAKKERQIELLQEKRAALISHAVTKGLDPTVPMKDSGIEWLGEIPAHWGIAQLRRVVAKFVDYRGHTPEKVESGVPLITARNIKNGHIDFSLSTEYMREDKYEDWMVRGWPEIGDVLITTEAPLGETAQVTDTRIALAQRIILLKVNIPRMINEYLKYHFLSAFGQGELWSRATGSTAIGIRADRFKDSLVAVPPLEEQEEIVHLLNSKITVLERPLQKIEQSIERLHEYRTALISAAVTGKIDVRGEQVQRTSEVRCT